MLNNNILRNFKVDVDVKRLNKIINTRAVFNTRDFKSAALTFNLKMDDKVLNLDNCVIVAKLLKTDNTEVTALCAIVDSKMGTVALGLDSQALSCVGEVQLELIIQDKEQELYTPKMVFMVTDNLYDEDEGIVSQSEYRVLNDLITKVQNSEDKLAVLNKTINENEKLRADEEAERVNAENLRVESINNIEADFKVIKDIAENKANLVDTKILEVDKKVTEVNLAKNNLTARVDAKILEVNSTKDNIVNNVNSKITEVNVAIKDITDTKNTVIADVNNKINEANTAISKVNTTNVDVINAENLRVTAEAERVNTFNTITDQLEITEKDIQDVIDMVGGDLL